MTALIPLVSALVIVLVVFVTGIGATWWPGLLIGLVGAVMAALGALSSYWVRLHSYRRSLAERMQRYQSEIARLEAQLAQLQEQQRTHALNNDPSPDVCLAIVQRRQRQLWNRVPGDDDFLSVRVGLGVLPASFSVTLTDQSMSSDSDPLLDIAADLRQRYAKTPNIPVTIALRAAGVLGVVGARLEAIQIASLLLIQLATHHAPDHLKIAAIFPSSEWKEWAWLRWLPHSWNEDHSFRYLASNASDANELVERIAERLLHQQIGGQALGAEEAIRDNVTLILLVAESFPGETGMALWRLMAEVAKKDICVVFLAARVRQLPPECTTIVRVASEGVEIIYQSEDQELYTQALELDRTSPKIFDDFARAMAPVRLARSSMEKRIGVHTLLDLYGELSVDRLDVEARWQRNGRSGASLAVPIGMAATGKRLLVDLHEKADGPHGLIAGTAGSGKSELLQTLVLSLAINYPPHRISFVLIDYKGGGTANLLASLPHTLGVITNLQEGELAQRAITSLRAEAERRQRLFAAAGINHIDAYQRAFDTQNVVEALPYLLIVVDEFAELKTDQPEIAREFVRIARIGRSLGFRLLLAMQKPTGIVDEQIEANMRLRICLRVAQIEDSQAMLRRPDAAYLTETGSALLQVGVERFERFQVGWGGAAHLPSDGQKQPTVEIVAVELNGRRRVLTSAHHKSAAIIHTQIEAVVAHIRHIAASVGSAPVANIWHPPLPQMVSLEQVRGEGGWDGKQWLPHARWMEPSIGLVDRPDQQRQDKLTVELARNGHLAIYGSARTDKTMLLQTLVTALALDHSADQLHVYIIELGSRQLRSLIMLPQVGDVIGAEDNEGMQRLIWMISGELQRRQQLLARLELANNAPFPAIVLMIDGYENLSRLGDLADNLSAHIQALAHVGVSVGIYLVLTGSHPTSVPFALSSSFGQTLVLQMVERNDYALALGMPVHVLPDAVPGRGIVRTDLPSLFQVALPATGSTDVERSQAHLALMKSMAATWDGPGPAPVPHLPEHIPLSHLAQPLRTSTYSQAVSLGLYVDSLRPVVVDLNEVGSALIAGSAHSGKSTLLHTWATALAEIQPPESLHLYVIDSGRRALASLAEIAHVKAYTATPAESDVVLQMLQVLIDKRLKALVDHQNDQERPSIVVLIDDLLDPFDEGVSESGKQVLAVLLRQGRRSGIHLLVASGIGDLIAKGWNEPAKTLKESQTGFLLGVAEDTVFSMRLPDNGRAGPMKPGEGFFVFRTRYLRVKLAMPGV